jgi:phosphate starvation-inducible protein PhoH
VEIVILSYKVQTVQTIPVGYASKILKGVEGIRFVYFSEIDVVRHRLVQEIIRAYNHLDRKKTTVDIE